MPNYPANATSPPYVERKDPDDILDYVFDWTDWLCTGEQLSSATFTVPTGLTEHASATGTATATVWLASGVTGTTYTVACLIETDQGRTCERSFRVIVEER